METSVIYDQIKFNELVIQTMDDFDLCIEEAIPSAISELEAQNISTKLLLTDINVVQGVDPITQFHQKYSDLEETDVPDLEEFERYLVQISNITSNDTKYQLYAGKLKIDEILKSICKWRVEEPTTLEMTLKCLKTMSTGYPDLIDEKFIGFLVNLLVSQSNCNLGELVWSILLESVKLHEINKEALFKNPKFVPLLKSCMENQNQYFIICCGIIYHLCKDDDIRQHISGAHSRATALADDFLLQLHQTMGSRVGVEKTVALAKAITGMIVNNNLVVRVYEADPCFKIINEVMTSYWSYQEVHVNVAKLIVALSGNEECRSKLGFLIPLITRSVDDHISSPDVVRSMCFVSCSLSLRSKRNATEFIKLNAVEKILQGMKSHPNTKVRKHGLMAFRNMASSSKNPTPFIEAGVVEYVNSLLASTSQPELTEECKSVLVALGATVSLTERWTGQRGDIVGHNKKCEGGSDC